MTALFYAFNLDDVVPQDHLLRHIDRFLDLSDLRQHLAPYYSHTGRPSVDPELMIRMLLIGYCLGIRSERRLCEEVKLNLAYRWFCRLSIEDKVPDHSTFSKNRHGRFREAEAFRCVFEQVLERCINAGLVSGEGFAVDASVVAAPGGPAFYAYSTNYLIDTNAGIVVDVEARPAHRTLEVQSTKTMIERVEDRFAIKTKKLIGDTAYGTAEFLGWMVNEKNIEPHVPVWDKGERSDGTFGRSDFHFDEEADQYTCPNGKELKRYRRAFRNPRNGITKENTIIYRCMKRDCEACPLKARCCANTTFRKITRSIHESARDVVREVAKTPSYRRTRRQRIKLINLQRY